MELPVNQHNGLYETGKLATGGNGCLWHSLFTIKHHFDDGKVLPTFKGAAVAEQEAMAHKILALGTEVHEAFFSAKTAISEDVLQLVS